LADKDKKKGRTGSKPTRREAAKRKTETTRSKAKDSKKPSSGAGKRGGKAKPVAARKKSGKDKSARTAPAAARTPESAAPTLSPAKPDHGWTIGPDLQRRAGLALIAASLLTVMAAGAWLGADPASGIVQWVARGLVQAVYAALLALFLWTFLVRRHAISYLLLFGVACAGVAAWDTSSGIYANRVRLEANDTLTTFRDTPLNVVDLTGIIERNPYVEAYMIMRDAHWELRNRLDDRMTGYGASYRTYVDNGAFLDIDRLRSRFELWRAFYQVGDLEDQLARIESSPVEADDLLWTVNLLDVDAATRGAYIQDFRDAVAAADKSQAALIAGERHTLARIKQSLQVLIDAKGRYRFAEGKVVFDSPADAALFTGKELPPD
jgi:hypothetical protein